MMDLVVWLRHQHAERCLDAAAEIERLNARIVEWSKTNLAIVAKCSDVERENATLRAAVGNAIERAEQAEAKLAEMIRDDWDTREPTP